MTKDQIKETLILASIKKLRAELSDLKEREKGDKGDTPTKQELLALIEPLIPEVKDGYTPRKGLDYFDGEKGDPGRDGISPDPVKIAVEASKMAQEELLPLIPTITTIEEDLPVLGDKIRDSLELLSGEERLDASAIKGLKEELEKLKTELSEMISSIPRRGGGGKKITSVRSQDLTSQVNGVLKTFIMPSGTLKVLGVWGTQFPITFNEGVDWTFSGRTLTLTDAVAAPETGQTLWALIENQFYA